MGFEDINSGENILLEKFLDKLSEMNLHESFGELNTQKDNKGRYDLLTGKHSMILFTSHNGDDEMVEGYEELVEYLKIKLENKEKKCDDIINIQNKKIINIIDDKKSIAKPEKEDMINTLKDASKTGYAF